MMSHPDREELMAWRDGEVPAPRSSDIREHVEQCANCADDLEALAALSARLDHWQVEPAPATLQPAARQGTTSSRSRRMVLWAAAAVVFIGALLSVRVECAPACDPRSVHFAWADRAPTSTRVDGDAQRSTPSAATAAFERDWLSRRRLPVPAVPGAKVTVVMYIDWQCPACRAAERAYGVVFAEFEQRAPGAIKVVMKDYPLNTRCNPNVPVEMHPAACDAAVAVRLAREHKTERAMIEWLFANQESLTPDAVRQAAASVGHVPDFAARSAAVLRDVAKDVAEGHGLEVGGTPTCFINGVLARNDNGRSLFRPEEVRLAIDLELKR